MEEQEDVVSKVLQDDPAIVEHIEKLEVKPGDLVVFHMQHSGGQVVSDFLDRMADRFPGVAFIALSKGQDLTVFGRQDIARMLVNMTIDATPPAGWALIQTDFLVEMPDGEYDYDVMIHSRTKGSPVPDFKIATTHQPSPEIDF